MSIHPGSFFVIGKRQTQVVAELAVVLCVIDRKFAAALQDHKSCVGREADELAATIDFEQGLYRRRYAVTFLKLADRILIDINP
jgi:hypothetical protein